MTHGFQAAAERTVTHAMDQSQPYSFRARQQSAVTCTANQVYLPRSIFRVTLGRQDWGAVASRYYEVEV